MINQSIWIYFLYPFMWYQYLFIIYSHLHLFWTIDPFSSIRIWWKIPSHLFRRSNGIMMPSITSIDELDALVEIFLQDPKLRWWEGSDVFLLDLDAEWQWVNLNLGIWKQDIWFYNLFLKLIVMMASSYISLPQSTKGWKFEDVIKSNDDVAEAICRNESYCPMSQMSQSPCLCWRHVEEAKQIATKYSTDPKAPMNLGKIGCIGIGVAFFCALHLALIHASIFNRFGSMIPATRTHNEMHQYGRKWGKESQSIISGILHQAGRYDDGIYPPAEWYWDTRRPWRRFWRRVLHIPWRKSNVWWRFWRGRCTREVWTPTPRYNVEILLFGSFAC